MHEWAVLIILAQPIQSIGNECHLAFEHFGWISPDENPNYKSQRIIFPRILNAASSRSVCVSAASVPYSTATTKTKNGKKSRCFIIRSSLLRSCVRRLSLTKKPTLFISNCMHARGREFGKDIVILYEDLKIER